MPIGTCFSDPAGLPPRARNRGAAPVLPGLRRMPLICFSYPDDMSRTGNPDASRSYPPGLRRMPNTTCFRY